MFLPELPIAYEIVHKTPCQIETLHTLVIVIDSSLIQSLFNIFIILNSLDELIVEYNLIVEYSSAYLEVVKKTAGNLNPRKYAPTSVEASIEIDNVTIGQTMLPPALGKIYVQKMVHLLKRITRFVPQVSLRKS